MQFSTRGTLPRCSELRCRAAPEAAFFVAGGKGLEFLQGFLHRGMRDLVHAGFLLPVFEVGDPGDEGTGECVQVVQDFDD